MMKIREFEGFLFEDGLTHLGSASLTLDSSGAVVGRQTYAAFGETRTSTGDMFESGGKRFKDRFTKAGMRWKRNGAERLLPVRAAVMSGRFDERWRTVYNSPPI